LWPCAVTGWDLGVCGSSSLVRSKSNQDPLMSLRSTSEYYQATLRPCLEELAGFARRQHLQTLRITASFLEVRRPYSVFRTGQRLIVWRVPTLQTRGVFRFSQPLDALFRPEPTGLVSCQIRSWGSPLQSFFLPCRCQLSPAASPSCRCASRHVLSQHHPLKRANASAETQE
jgi:hypothetical protein